MGRNISDLLDGYPADVDLETSTPLSPSRIEELTMNMIGQNETKKRRFSPRVVVVTALAAALLCTSALAAGNVLGAGDWFRSYFGGDLSDGQVEVMDRIGRTFEGPDGATPAAVTDNGATLTPLAALADENVYYLRLRVEAPEGTVLPDLDGDTEGYYQLSGNTSENVIRLKFSEENYSYGYSAMFFWQPDSDPTDHVKEVVIRIVGQSGTDLNFLDGVSKQLTIHGLWIQSPDKVYTPVFTGEFTFDIGLSYEGQSISLDCGGALLTDETYGFTNSLDRLDLSPLGMTAYCRSTLAENDWVMPGVGPVQIILKDGTLFWPEAASGRPEQRHPNFDEACVKDDFVTDFSLSFVFDQPLDLEQVDYILYGDTRIDLDR